ncbi:hypothetical protein H257_10344 [Aphanomyces astaci]|uniref:Uncharacterized protein n=1 Tax=Aphanomyces astaci TaxID=112090 RepID=W4G8Z1_APHAT|nr:hypothetical protein H257_10344 [Aphanomyces astaci]ETV75524.1 hypothetical protein H257_10344 [Aphanomyces astaci]RQM27144.1 hypothetical protein B5M09_004447 [Aphanomyces astaci]|eukprot:XP_009835158.1 hypothetical protein H257_10344 [Aphanomyces astaci]
MQKRRQLPVVHQGDAVLRSKELLRLVFDYQGGIFFEFMPLHLSMAPFRRVRRGEAIAQAVEDRPTDDHTLLHDILSAWLHHSSPFTLVKMLQCMHYMRSLVAFHAVCTGNLLLVHQLHDAFGICTFDGPLLDLAARHEHLRMLLFLHKEGHPGCSTAAMDAAAKHGYFDIVTFLHFHRTEGCTTDAMDDAAAAGHEAIVLFLHVHRTEGCTSAAMDRAATAGHFDTVMTLHNIQAGCTSDAVDGAALGGHLRIVILLLLIRHEIATPRALMHAARRGDLAMVKFVYSHLREGLSYADMKRIIDRTRDADVLSFLGSISLLPFSDEDDDD